MTQPIQLHSPDPVAPGQTAVVSHKAEASIFVSAVIPDEGSNIAQIFAGDQSLTSLGDGVTVPVGHTLAFQLVNAGPEAKVLGITINAIALNAEPIPFSELGARIAGLDAQALAGVPAPAAAPATANVLAGPFVPPVNMPQAPQTFSPAEHAGPPPSIAQAAQGMGWSGSTTVGAAPQSPQPGTENLQLKSAGPLFRQFEPVVRDANDPRPPPPKVVGNMGGQGGGRGVRMGPVQPNVHPQTPLAGRVAGGMKMFPTTVGTAAPAPVQARPTSVVREAGERVTNARRSGVQIGGNAPHSLAGRNGVHVGAAVPQGAVMHADGSSAPTAAGSDTHLLAAASPRDLTGLRPLVLGHAVAKSVQQMLERRMPIIKAHKDAVGGALSNASLLDPAAYAGREAELWQRGSVIAWVAPSHFGALALIMAAGRGTTEDRAGQHDALPYLVEAFSNALDPSTFLIHPSEPELQATGT